MSQALIILSSIILGLLLPEFSQYSFLIPYLLGTMLFFSFIKTKIPLHIFTEKHIYIIVLANILIGWASYCIILPFGQELAFMAFFVGMIPTALASPAVVSIIGGNVPFTLAVVLISNFGIGLTFPFFSAIISPIEISVTEMMLKIFILLAIPFFLAEIIKYFFPIIQEKIVKQSFIVFYIWAAIIILAITKSSSFLRENWDQYSYIIFPIAIITAIICVINFTLGHYIGGKKFAKEGSQTLGQKNPMLMIWIALQFFSPLMAIGPTFYIIFHNLVNSWKLMNAQKKK